MIGAISSIKIYNPVGSVYFSNVNRTSTDFPITDQCERSAKLMGDDYVRLQFKLYDKITFDAFSFIEYDNQTFFLREQYVPTPNGTKKEDGGDVSSAYYTYDLKFVSVANMLDKHICYRYVKVGENEWYEPEININGNISTMYVIVMGAIKRVAEQYINTLYGHLLSTIYANGMAADGINPNTDNVRLTEGTKLLTFNFSGDSIANVCTTIANNYTNEDKKDTEWYITEEHGATPEFTKLTLHFAKCISNENEQTFGDYVRRGNNLHPYTSGGLKKVEYAQAWSGIAQTLVPFGSDRNMSGQSVKGIDEITNLQSTFGKRLRLDTLDKDGNPMKYKVHDLDGVEHEIEIDSRGGIRNEFVNTGIEKVVFFDEVYPQGHFRVEKVEVKNKRQDEETIPEYTITALPIDSDGNVIPKDALSPVQNGGNGYYPIRIEEGTTLSVRFESGMLAGREFEIANKSHKDYDAPTYSMKFTIVADGSIEDGTLIPSGNFRPYGDLSTSTAEKAPSGKGDTFALFNMKMPDVYIEQAKQELAQKAYEELLKIQTTRPEVKCSTDPTNFNGDIALGNVINAQSELFNAEGYTFHSRVISYSYKLTKTTDIQFSLASAVMQGTLSSMNDMIADVTHTAGGLEQRAVNLSRRAWRDASEMAEMLDSMRSEMMLVGEEKYQFTFTSAIECNNVSNKFAGLNIGYGSLQHTQEPYISYNNGWWEISGQTLNKDEVGQPLDSAKAYYLYAKVDDTSTPATMVLNENAYSTDVDTDTEYLLLGILSSEFEGQRVFNRTNGFSSIAGGTITTEQIQDANRDLIIDFQSKRIIARKGAQIVGNIRFLSADGTSQTINEYLDGSIGGENILAQSTFSHEYKTGQTLALTHLIPLEAGKKYVCTKGKFEDNAAADEEWARGVCLVVAQDKNVELIESVHRFNEPIEVNGNGRYLYIAWGAYDYVNYVKGSTPSEVVSTNFTQYLDYVMVQEGEIPTSYLPYVNHLISSIQGSTEIDGGLVMTNVLGLKDENNNVVAGMSGMSDNVLTWGGCNYEDAAYAADHDYKDKNGYDVTTLIKKDGKGKIGVFKIDNKQAIVNVSNQGAIAIDASNESGGIRVQDKESNDKVVLKNKDINLYDIFTNENFEEQISGEKEIKSAEYTDPEYPLQHIYTCLLTNISAQENGLLKIKNLHIALNSPDVTDVSLPYSYNIKTTLRVGNLESVVSEYEYISEYFQTDINGNVINKIPASSTGSLDVYLNESEEKQYVVNKSISIYVDIRVSANGCKCVPKTLNVNADTCYVQKSPPCTIIGSNGMCSFVDRNTLFGVINQGRRQKVYTRGLGNKQGEDGELYIAEDFASYFEELCALLEDYFDRLEEWMVSNVGTITDSYDVRQKLKELKDVAGSVNLLAKS